MMTSMCCYSQMALLAAAFAKYEMATKDTQPGTRAAVAKPAPAAPIVSRKPQQQKPGSNLPPGQGGAQAKAPAEAADGGDVMAEPGATAGTSPLATPSTHLMLRGAARGLRGTEGAISLRTRLISATGNMQ